jgi:hypothetical protein
VREVLLLLSIAACLSAQDRPQFTWQGHVDGTAILRVTGKRLTVQIQDGAPVEGEKYHFSDALPQTRQKVRLEVLEGRGLVRVIDPPGIENRYTLGVEIEDRQPGSSFYSIALYWDTSGNFFEQNEKTDKLVWTGRVDEEAVISCRKQTCMSSVEHGAPVVGEKFKFSRPMPEREVEVRLQDSDGRGEIRLIEQPSRRNDYTARVAIRDPIAGSSEYSFTLVWKRIPPNEATAPVPEPSGRGLEWSGTVEGRVRVTVQGGASFSEALEGAPVSGERSEMVRPIPKREGVAASIRKLRGRGSVVIVEQPSEKNNYRLVFEIDDPMPGADYYQVEVSWSAVGG